MTFAFDPEAWDPYLYWPRADPKIVRKINALIKECLRYPFEGTGKPEPLRGILRAIGRGG